jgi:chemotaxis protein histidine kinase CheA
VALPASRVEAVLGLSEGTVEGTGGDAFFVWREEPLPLVDLVRCLGLSSSSSKGRDAVVVVETQGFRLGLRVDRVAAHREVFVREVPTTLLPIAVLAGAAILPDGDPVFLLEVGQLVEELM